MNRLARRVIAVEGRFTMLLRDSLHSNLSWLDALESVSVGTFSQPIRRICENNEEVKTKYNSEASPLIWTHPTRWEPPERLNYLKMKLKLKWPRSPKTMRIGYVLTFMFCILLHPREDLTMQGGL